MFKLISFVLIYFIATTAMANITAKNLFAPQFFVVRNVTQFDSRVRVLGQWSQVAPHQRTSRYPWAAVLNLCKNHQICLARVYVFTPAPVAASILRVDTKSGKVNDLQDFNHFHVLVNGFGIVTLIHY